MLGTPHTSHISSYFYVHGSSKDLLEFKAYPSHGSLLLNTVFSLFREDLSIRILVKMYVATYERWSPLFVLRYFTVFITFCVCSFSYETSVVEEQESLCPCSLVPTISLLTSFHWTKKWIYIKFAQHKYDAELCLLRSKPVANAVNAIFGTIFTLVCKYGSKYGIYCVCYRFALEQTVLHHICAVQIWCKSTFSSSVCSPKPLENPHYSFEMKLHSHFVLFIFKTNRDSNLRPLKQSHWLFLALEEFERIWPKLQC